MSCLRLALGSGWMLALSLVFACGGGVTSPAACTDGDVRYCDWGTCLDAPVLHCKDGQWDGTCGAAPANCRRSVDAGGCGDGGMASCVTGDAGLDAAHDAAPVDAPSSVACGTTTCDAATQFCRGSGGGPPPPPDSGFAVSYACVAYPAACAADHACACLKANGGCPAGAVFMCSIVNGEPRVDCGFP